MSQFDFGTIEASTKSGTALATDLNSWRDTVHSCHKGSSAPSYAVAGLQWIDDTSDPLWLLKRYDGTSWAVEAVYNTTTDRIYPSYVPGQLEFEAAGGTANALTLTPTLPMAAYSTLDRRSFRASADNTGATTLNVSGVGAKAIRRIIAGADVALIAGNMLQNRLYDVTYQSSANGGAGAWILINPSQPIKGTVSQSGGIPTGAIIERGSNANGEYVRYADGTQICWNSSIASQDCTTATGSLFRTTTGTTWTYPVAFASTPVVSVSATGATRFGSCSGPTATSAEVFQLSGASSASANTTGAKAIGRWF